jgi:hypothetical protein
VENPKDVFISRYTIGANINGGKLTANFIDTGGKLTTGVNNTGSHIFYEFTLIAVTQNYVRYGVTTPKFIWAQCAQLYSLATPLSPPPPIWAHIRRRYWSAKKDDITL